MRNIKITIQYDGTRYSGWQFQKNAMSIQEAIEDCINKVTGERSRVTGASRTDAGVHARCQVANFKTRSGIPVSNLQRALNSSLPKDIVISDMKEVHPAFDSQRSAVSKVYRYAILNSDFADPFVSRFSARYFYKLDLKRMRKGARALIGRHDYKSFQTAGGNPGMTTIRTIRFIKIEKRHKLIYIYIKANGFLYNMVRNIVGTLVEVGRGKTTPESIKDILSKKDRRYSGPAAPAKGLSLIKVNY